MLLKEEKSDKRRGVARTQHSLQFPKRLCFGANYRPVVKDKILKAPKDLDIYN